MKIEYQKKMLKATKTEIRNKNKN